MMQLEKKVMQEEEILSREVANILSLTPEIASCLENTKE